MGGRFGGEVGDPAPSRKERAVMKRFPDNFLWGSATAPHQVEGGNANSDCWALEQARPSMFPEPSGDTVDQWNRFEDDIAVLAALGLNTYRFGIEWARIEPQPGQYSQAALDHYQRCIDACLRVGVAPMLSFHHFTSPIWLTRLGGLNNADYPERFGRYCAHAAARLDGFGWACTFNELNVPVLVEPMFNEKLRTPEAAPVRAAAEAALGGPLANFFLTTPRDVLLTQGLAAHAAGRDAIKSVRPAVQVGLTLSIQDEQAEPGGEVHRDRRLEKYVDPFLDAVRGDDFIGVQTYTRYISRADGGYGPAPGEPVTTMGFADRPQALAQVCRRVWERTRTPIIVTENGWAGDQDERREQFIIEALDSLHDVIAQGADIRGYYYWTLLDNYEWLSGYKQRFGLLDVDRATQRRTIKPSAVTLGQIARHNAVDAGAPVPRATSPIKPPPFAASAAIGVGAPLGMA
jgi:beta-glucosidase